MRFFKSLLEIAILGRKGNTRRGPMEKPPKRFGPERLEPRMMLSAAGGGHAVMDLSPPAAAASFWFATISAPAAPALTAEAVSASQANLAWTAETGSTGYKVYELTAGAWEQIATVAGGTTNYSATGLTAGTTLCFDVAAYNSVGAAWAPGVGVTTFAANAPAAPSLTAMAVSASQVDLAWTGGAGVTRYKVYESAGGGWSQIAALGSNTSYCVAGLNAATMYSFDVAAQNSGGVTWAPARKVSTPWAFILEPTIEEPAASAAYSPVSGVLFGPGGPSYLDVQQGSLGDCWLLSSLAEVAAQAPQDIRNMFNYEGTMVENGAMVGLYQVRFFNSGGAAQYVTVDTELPAGGTYYDQAVNGILWAALAEKAYAEANGAGIVTTGDSDSNSYAALSGGDPRWALQAITGQPATDYYVNTAGIAAAWQAGGLVVLGSSSAADDNLIVGDSSVTHAYAVIGYDPSSSTPFGLYNPWGESGVGAMTTYNGSPVYGGAFYASQAMISQDFMAQSDGAGTGEFGITKHHQPATPAEVLFASLDMMTDLAYKSGESEILKVVARFRQMAPRETEAGPQSAISSSKEMSDANRDDALAAARELAFA